MSPTARKTPAQKAAAKKRMAAAKKKAAVAKKKAAVAKKKAAAVKKKAAAVKKKAAAVKKKAAAVKKKAAAVKKKAAAVAKKKAAEAAKKKAEEERRIRAEEAELRKKQQAEAAELKRRDRARAKAPPPSGPLHPKLGYKYVCFDCSTKFYDLNKPEPVCPKCGADQRDRPLLSATSAPSSAPKKRPMQPLLEDEEDTLPAAEDGTPFEEASEANPELGDTIFGGTLEGEPVSGDAENRIDPEDIKL